VPATRDEPAERPVDVGIDVERLRVELAREADDLVCGDPMLAVDRLRADDEILPVPHCQFREWTTTSVFVGRVSAT
jgi:hypothetical protein